MEEKKTKKLKKKHLYFFIALIIIFLIVLAYTTTNNFNLEKKNIRKTAVAGSWYPDNKATLDSSIQEYLNNVNKAVELSNIKALIVPHAGYRFSGQVAATAFKQLDDIYKTVIIIGPSHKAAFNGASIPDVTHYETPLGLIKISKKAKTLLKEDIFQSHPTAHLEEHDIEIELPFLQSVLTNFEIIPILIGASTTKDELESIAQTLKNNIDDKTLIVISTDFTHYGPNYGYIPFEQDIPANLNNLDMAAVDRILSRDPKGFLRFLDETKCTICGRLPITILLYMIEGDPTIKPYLLYYTTSGAITNDYSNSVSYITMAFTGEISLKASEDTKDPLTNEEQDFLLRLARKTAEEYLNSGKKLVIDDSKLTPDLKKVQGCFTTFNKNHNLRGCIGHILPQEELYKCVMDNAVNAAVNDRRFNPVESKEMQDIVIEISVLTVPEPLEFNDGEDLKDKLRPMVDGVVLKQGFKQSTYLPQVWANFNSKEEFLTSLCRKGGMPENCWQDTSTEVFTYQAFVFEE